LLKDDNATVYRYVDYMLLMTYNYHGNWNEFTGHHSAMFPRSDEVAGEREWNQVNVTYEYGLFYKVTLFSIGLLFYFIVTAMLQ